MYDARQIANWFLIRAQKDNKLFPIVTLLRLCFFAHGWHLEMRKAGLFKNDIEAWGIGPIVPNVYHSFRSQGQTPQTPVPGYSFDLPDYDEKILEQIYQIYGHLDSFQLSKLCKSDGGPWDLARRYGGPFSRIYDREIKTHFENLRREADIKQKASA